MALREALGKEPRKGASNKGKILEKVHFLFWSKVLSSFKLMYSWKRLVHLTVVCTFKFLGQNVCQENSGLTVLSHPGQAFSQNGVHGVQAFWRNSWKLPLIFQNFIGIHPLRMPTFQFLAKTLIPSQVLFLVWNNSLWEMLWINLLHSFIFQRTGWRGFCQLCQFYGLL